jgi:hypothetical protein
LKGRLAEIAALGEISADTRSGLQPFVEVVPNGQVESVESIGVSCEKTVEKLAQSWAGEAAFVDCGYLDLEADLGGGGGAVDRTCRSAESRGVRATPVLRVDDPDLARRDVRVLHEDYDRGVAVRIVGDDLDEDPDDLDAALDQLLVECGLDRCKADVVFDAGAVDGDVAARGAARVIGSLFRDISDVGYWRSITVTGGAFPADLSAYDPFVVGERPRFDADMWAHVVNRNRCRRQPDYGDYAISHPLATGAPFASAPQLHYTTGRDWLILKAKRSHLTDEDDQFYRICDAIAHHPRFVGAALGTADARIANSRDFEPGNATTWRQIGTTHHLDLVVSRITTLGEP